MSAPTYEGLAALVVALQGRIAEQDARIAELERQLVVVRKPGGAVSRSCFQCRTYCTVQAASLTR